MSLNSRKIAFCVASWSSSSTVLTWAWLRQYFLHRETDELYIVHTGKNENWKAGGPLGADIDTALQNWRHQFILLQGSLQSNIAKVVAKHGIDVVVLSEDFPRQSGFQIGDTSDWVRSNITCPFIIIRASAVRNEKLRLASSTQLLGSPASPTQKGVLSPESAPGRKVAIAYPSFPVGLHLIELAKQMVLLPQDEIFVVHCFPNDKSNLMRQTKSILLRTVTLGLADTSSSGLEDRGGSEEEFVTEELSLEFGEKELAGYNVHLGVVLRGDPRIALTSFCESEGIELLVISTRMAGFIRKTLTGGSVSGYLIDKAPCPSIVFPLKTRGGLMTEDDEGPLSPNSSGEQNWVPPNGGSSGATPAGLSPTEPLSPSMSFATLQAQLVEKDKTIAALREELEQLKAKLGEEA